MSQPVYFKSANIQVYPSIKRSPAFDYSANRFSEQSIRQIITDLTLADQQAYIPWHYSPELINLMNPDPNVFDLSVNSSTDILTLNGKIIIQGYMIELIGCTVNVAAIKASNTKHYIYLTLNTQNIEVPLNTANQFNSNTIAGYDRVFDEYIEAQNVTQASFSSNTYYKLENGVYEEASTFESDVIYYIKCLPKYTGAELSIDIHPPATAANICKIGEIQWVNNNYNITVYSTTYIADTLLIRLLATTGFSANKIIDESLTEWLSNDFIIDDGDV